MEQIFYLLVKVRKRRLGKEGDYLLLFFIILELRGIKEQLGENHQLDKNHIIQLQNQEIQLNITPNVFQMIKICIIDQK